MSFFTLRLVFLRALGIEGKCSPVVRFLSLLFFRAETEETDGTEETEDEMFHKGAEQKFCFLLAKIFTYQKESFLADLVVHFLHRIV